MVALEPSFASAYFDLHDVPAHLMRIAVLCAHEVHNRNWYASGLVQRLAQCGHTVINLDANPPTFYRLRRSLRLMTMVQMEPRLRTYAHKATLLRGRRRLQAALYRHVRCLGVNLESVAQRIEACLPIPSHVLRRVEVAKPDVLLWPTLLHMDAVENDTIKAARQRGIPIVGVPASWDNLTTKGQFLVRPDRLIVWGEASRRHATTLHGFADDRVDAPGPPHFTPYEEGVLPLGTDIYVNGTSIHYWPDEDALVQQLRMMLSDRTVLHSQHPRRRGAYPDLGFVRRQLEWAQCLVAAFSTVVIEAALCGRPVFLIGFGAGQQGEAMAALGHVPTPPVAHTQYEHMREVLALPGIQVAHTMRSLCAMIRAVQSGSYDPALAEAQRAAALLIADARPGLHDRLIEAIEHAA